MVTMGDGSLRPIETLEVGDRVMTYTPEERLTIPGAPKEAVDSYGEFDELYKIELRLDHDECDESSMNQLSFDGVESSTNGVATATGLSTIVTLLRDKAWLIENRIRKGGTFAISMPEMGVEGEASIDSVSSFQISKGQGQLVTATFHHSSGEVYDLYLKDCDEPIGVTANHPFWSVDRVGWVPAANVQFGETLMAIRAKTLVERHAKRNNFEDVYNIEIEGDHVYRVHKHGVLVHNASAGGDRIFELAEGPEACGCENISLNIDPENTEEGWGHILDRHVCGGGKTNGRTCFSNLPNQILNLLKLAVEHPETREILTKVYDGKSKGRNNEINIEVKVQSQKVHLTIRNCRVITFYPVDGLSAKGKRFTCECSKCNEKSRKCR